MPVIIGKVGETTP